MTRQVQSAGLAVRVTMCVPALAILIGLAWAPAVPAQSSGYPPYRLYLPWSSGSFHLYLPYFHNDVSDMFTAAWPPASSSVPSSSMGFVTRVGENLQLDGQPYTFVGTNVSYLAGPYFPEEKVDEIMAYLARHGVQVMRVWIEPGRDLERVERMLDLGRKYHVHFILTLQNFFNQGDGWWFKAKYLTIDLPHIQQVVPRFANRPEILAWELMNEPTCPAQDANASCWNALVNWADVTSHAIKQLDPNHLVSVGTQRGGFDAQAMDAFRRMHALESVDLMSLHMQANPTPQYEYPQELAIAHELKKPVYFGEVSFPGRPGNGQGALPGALDYRAQYIVESILGSRKVGVDGLLIWQYGDGPADLTNRLDFFTADPVWDAIQAMPPR